VNFKAVQDVVIIRRTPQQEISAGGIFLVDSKDFLEDIGTVEEAGPGKLSSKGVFIPNDVKKGDIVLFSTGGHQVTKLNGTEFIVTRQNSIMAVLNESARPNS
jgi:chaperonin GroES